MYFSGKEELDQISKVRFCPDFDQIKKFLAVKNGNNVYHDRIRFNIYIGKCMPGNGVECKNDEKIA